MVASMIELEVPDNDAAEPNLFAESFRTNLISVPEEWYDPRLPPAPEKYLLRDRRSGGGVLPVGEVASIIAAGGVGKTMILLQLAIAVATGEPWLENFTIDPAHMGRVLILLGEEKAKRAHARLHAACRHHRAPKSGDIMIKALSGVPSSFMAEDDHHNPIPSGFHADLQAFLKEERFALVIVDPMSRFAGKDVEKDTTIATYFVALLEALETTLLLSHHTPKASRGKNPLADPSARGVTALFDGVRSELVLKSESYKSKIEDPDVRQRLGEIVILSNSKANYGPKFDDLSVRRGEDGPLVPVGEDDLKFLAEIAGSKARKKERSDEEAERRATRERLEEDRKRKKAEATAQATAQAAERAAAALLEFLASSPGASVQDVYGGLRALLGTCSHPAADAALARGRLDGTVVVRKHPRTGRLSHYLPSNAPPELVSSDNAQEGTTATMNQDGRLSNDSAQGTGGES